MHDIHTASIGESRMGRSRKSHGKRSGKTAAAPTSPVAVAPAPEARHGRIWWLPLGVALLVLVLLGVWWLRTPASPVMDAPVASSAAAPVITAPMLPPAHYVGAQACASCHTKE